MHSLYSIIGKFITIFIEKITILIKIYVLTLILVSKKIKLLFIKYLTLEILNYEFTKTSVVRL